MLPYTYLTKPYASSALDQTNFSFDYMDTAIAKTFTEGDEMCLL